MALVLPGAAAAQAPLAVGQSVRGALAASDSKLDDGTHYRCYRMQTQPGVLYRVEMRSDAFDAYLGLGKRCPQASETNDDGAGGTNARIEFTGDGGTWLIRAGSLSEGEAGPFVVSVSDLGQAPVLRTVEIDFGQTLRGALTNTDAVAEDESYFDCYVFTGRADQAVVVNMRSDDFDAYASLYEGGSCIDQQLTADDDSGGGTDARLETTLLASGLFSIRANSLGSHEVGAYQITLSTAAQNGMEMAVPPTVVYFHASSDMLTPEAKAALDEAVSQISLAGAAGVIVAAHSDAAEGTPEFAIGLSQRRANAAREYLIGRGLPSGLITTQAYGASLPITESPGPQPDNRRVEVSIGAGSGW